MTIYDKGLIKAMKAAYRDGGYDVAVTENGVLIQASGWGVEILADAVPNSVKSLIVLHNGNMPRMGSAVHVEKGECSDMILDTATATMEALAKGYAVSGGRPIKPTRLTFDGCRLWQAEDNLAVFMVDPDDQQILLGEQVEWWWGWGQYDKVYMSKVFDDTYTPDIPEPLNAKEIIKGGTGYGLDNCLPDEIEHMMPDYSLYPDLTKDTAYGFLSRGCPNACPFCIVSEKEGRCSRKVADLSEWWSGQKNIVLMDPNLLACRDHMDLLRQLAESGAWVDINQGLDARLLTPENIEAIKRIKIKNIHFAWDLMRNSAAICRGPRTLEAVGEENAPWVMGVGLCSGEL